MLRVFVFIGALLLADFALCQIDTLKLHSEKSDSIQAKDKRVEAYLRRIIEEAKDVAQRQVANYDMLEIDELIVDATLTKAGNDFFYYFSNSFQWPESPGGFIVEVSEQPFRLNNTQITIKVNELEVFKNMLQPRATFLEELAAYAQQLTRNYITNYAQIMKELDGEDLSGSGIY